MSRITGWRCSHIVHHLTNLGDYYQAHGKDEKAIAAFKVAHKLRPDVIIPPVNLSQAYARPGKQRAAEDALRKAYKLDPTHGAVILISGC